MGDKYNFSFTQNAQPNNKYSDDNFVRINFPSFISFCADFPYLSIDDLFEKLHITNDNLLTTFPKFLYSMIALHKLYERYEMPRIQAYKPIIDLIHKHTAEKFQNKRLDINALKRYNWEDTLTH